MYEIFNCTNAHCTIKFIFQNWNLAQSEANCSYVAGIKFVEIVKVLVLTKTHKRNQEWDQVGHWTPLEGAKVYFRRSQNLPWIR